MRIVAESKAKVKVGQYTGLRNDPIWYRWKGIIRRCYHPSSEKFKDYGARGITVCEEWKVFQNFRSWAIQSGFDKSLTIDRIDVNGHYSPENCRWATQKSQQRNRRNNRKLVAFGEEKLVCEWCEDTRCKVPANILWNRINHGWNPEDAMTRQVQYRRPRKTKT